MTKCNIEEATESYHRQLEKKEKRREEELKETKKEYTQEVYDLIEKLKGGELDKDELIECIDEALVESLDISLYL